uniref:Spermatogenesis-associated protein 4 n=1 Tax=Salarias fasciatus TaxID=181472 RepID=A0A672HQS9_SALFA
MFNSQRPERKTLQREVLKWLQTLNLSFYPKNVRRDFSNGYLVAEIFSHYFSEEFSLHSYDKGTSLSVKQRNWSQIERSLQKQNVVLMKEAVDGTIHCKPGAAEYLVQQIYTILTDHSIQNQDPDFTDREYQDTLPALARSTACQAIKNNLTGTEIMAKPDINTNQRRAAAILRRHLEGRTADRLLNPGRFKVNPSHAAPKNPVPAGEDEDCCDSPASRSEHHASSL